MQTVLEFLQTRIYGLGDNGGDRFVSSLFVPANLRIERTVSQGETHDIETRSHYRGQMWVLASMVGQLWWADHASCVASCMSICPQDIRRFALCLRGDHPWVVYHETSTYVCLSIRQHVCMSAWMDGWMTYYSLVLVVLARRAIPFNAPLVPVATLFFFPPFIQAPKRDTSGTAASVTSDRSSIHLPIPILTHDEP